MLKLTKKVEYALMAVRHLQNKKNAIQLCSSNEIANSYNIPKPLLAKILQQLAKRKIIKAVKGPNGGYKMARDTTKVNMTEFFEIIEGPVGLVDCFTNSGCSLIDCCSIQDPIGKINNSIKLLFDKMTLAEVTY